MSQPTIRFIRTERRVMECRTLKLKANRSPNKRTNIGYIKGRSALPSSTSSTLPNCCALKDSQILIWRFFSSTPPTHTSTLSLLPWYLRLLRKSQTPEDEEGVVYSDHSRDERHQNRQQNQQQVGLDLNTTANGSQESAGRNAESGGTQNGQLNQGGNNPEGRRNTSTFDRLGPGHPEPRPFGGIGSDDTQIMQDLIHRMQAMELEVKELRKENTELKNVAQDLRARRRSPL
ncbi:hypothetical protein PIB30_002249 [Stylosanthes scabra]|uniref:Uncharacterized protein n=1 Tax=Stylosanthes scabra TaxID=79078 RepID=A0ABU6T2S5_9FABA|nr:hypothetical protein [Stylosanthes scabra]